MSFCREKVFEFGLIFDVRLIAIVLGIDKYVTSIQLKVLHSLVFISCK